MSDTNTASSINKKRKKAERGPNQRLRQRTAILIVVILILGFGAAVTRIGYLTLVQGSELQESAVGQQLRDTEVTAKRGTIYDANGTVLAESASVWMVVLAPAYFENDGQREAVAKGLSEILGLDYDNVLQKTQQNSYYVVVKRKIEADVRAEVLEFIDEMTDPKGYACYSNVIQLKDDYKRYYPNNELASAVIGFTGSDEQGLEGLEYEYDDYLTGTAGRIVTAKNARNTDMPYEYEQSVDAEDGNNVYLTIDATVQAVCEKYMQQGVRDNNVLNKGTCIMMDVNTGEILAMVTTDGYDLNDPYTLPEDEQKRIDELPKDEQSAAENEALYAMWRNKAVADTYMPGSVFKICTASMALEEGLIDDVNSYAFYCGGSAIVADQTIHCHDTAGHGGETFVDAIVNSCNPAFIQIGQKIGGKKFWQYYQSFGFSEKTGIDLPGEAEDQFFTLTDDGSMNEVDLAVAAFGQNFTITPIQMITACSAVANGGYVLKPHIVSKITDSEGNLVKTFETTVKRQVISKETSDTMNEILEYNTSTAGSTSGYVAGYRVAGKTGTSEKIGSTEVLSRYTEDYIASFCGYAPADDPQVALLVFFDTPNGSSYYGSQVAAPVFINIMSEVMPYLDVKTSYTDDELKYVDTNAGSYTGLSVESAKSAVEADGFTVTVKGDGDTVISQIPAANATIPQGGGIVLYTDSDSASQTVTVPNLVGYSISAVNSVASNCGLNVSLVGASGSGAVISASQDIEAGQQVSPGTVITVTFTSTATFAD